MDNQVMPSDKKEVKKFYDIHVHALDLSHPNLSAFLFKDDLFRSLVTWKFRALCLFVPLLSVIPSSLINRTVKKLIEKSTFDDTLSFYELPLEYQFLLWEYFLRNPNNKGEKDKTEEDKKHKILNKKGEFSLDEKRKTTFNKIVLCPLAIDFFYQNSRKKDNVFYNKTVYKPIIKQTGDLFYAIRTYYRFKLDPKGNDCNDLKLVEIKEDWGEKNLDEKMEGWQEKELNEVVKEWREKQLSEIKKDLIEIKKEKLFEIYPFMGLNTQNYSLEKIDKMLNKYFSNFKKDETKTERRERLYEKIGVFDGKMFEENEDIYKDIFAGIKVYPPLNFDPYPDKEEEKKKVELLYQYCVDKRIPIITHCSDGGFKVGNYDDCTNPNEKWKKVLEEYPDLTLCFAHFGRQEKWGRKNWKKMIIEFIEKYEYKNVYADISCNCSTPKYYKELNKLMKEHSHLENKIIFGSDFSINMLASQDINSYNTYLRKFIDGAIDPDVKKKCV
ncbi:MAG: amidohydrolase [Culturomica sp.]|jgi:hypothetical protein|nr:amidohydrolase [Culturomica sp.]